MKTKTTLLILLFINILVFTFILYSCKHDITVPANYGYKGPCHCPSDSIKTDTSIKSSCSPDTVYFQNSILPLIQSSCGMTNCHDGNGEAKSLLSYANIISSRYVIAGDSSQSKMYGAITGNGEDIMPPYPYSKLSVAQINLIAKWISQGTKNNYCKGCDTTNVHFSTVIWPIIRDNCESCHSGSSPTGGISLQSYQNVMSVVNDGRLIKAINGNGVPRMPLAPASQLSSCYISQITKWVNNGAKND